jgi:hypothetical protein
MVKELTQQALVEYLADIYMGQHYGLWGSFSPRDPHLDSVVTVASIGGQLGYPEMLTDTQVKRATRPGVWLW